MLVKLIMLLSALWFLGDSVNKSEVQAQPLAPGFKIRAAATMPPVPRCRREDLSIKEGETDAAMGGVRVTPYILTNTSSSACTLDGYPSVELLNGRGAVVKRSTQQKSDEPVSLVLVETGKTAWFSLNYNSGGAGYMGRPCPTYNKIRIRISGVTSPVVFRSSIQTCPRTDFQVTSIQSGAPQ